MFRPGVLVVLCGLLVACAPAAGQPPTAGPAAAAPSSPQRATAVESTATAAPPAREEVRYGFNPILAGGPMYVAQLRGYFDEQGLDVTFTPFDSAALMVAPVAAGHLEVMPAVSSPSLFNALARDIPLKLVAAMSWSEVTLSVRKELIDSGEVKTLPDLRGRRVSFNVEGSPVDFGLRHMLRANGMSMRDVDVQRVSNTDTGPALSNGALDAGVASDPIPLLLEQRGIAIRFMNSREILPRLSTSIITFGPSMLDRGNDVPTRFLVAYVKGLRDWFAATQNRYISDAFVLDSVRHWTNMPADTIAQTPVPLGDPNGRVDLADLERQQEFWAQEGMVPSKVDLARFVDYRYLEAALALLP